MLVLRPDRRGIVSAGQTLLRQVGLVGGRGRPRAAEDGLELPRLSLNPLDVLWTCLLRYNKQEEHNLFPAWWLLLNHQNQNEKCQRPYVHMVDTLCEGKMILECFMIMMVKLFGQFVQEDITMPCL